MLRKIKLLPAIGAFCCVTVSAGPIELPKGMGGTPNIGAIPCAVFSEMIRVGPKGTRLSLLTWAEGYFFATTGKTLNEIIEDTPGAAETYDFYGVTDRFVEYCEANPEATTGDAVLAFGAELLST